jgi:hypothetical protein
VRKDIRIPHIGFFVLLRPKPKGWDAYASTLYAIDAQNSKRNYVKLILPDNCTASALAHELTHVLGAIERYTGAEFGSESEHYGFMMQYLMEQVIAEQRKVRAGKRKKR